MAKFLQMLEQWIGGGPGGSKRIQTFRWLIIIGLLGVFLLIIQSFLQVESVDSLIEDPSELTSSHSNNDREVFLDQDKGKSPFEIIEQKYENKLKEILEKMVGVGGVEVLVNIENTEEIIVYQDRQDTQHQTLEKDQHGASRQITEISRNGKIVMHEISGNESPIILKTIKPKIRGVVIVANGAENPTVHNMILEAVRRGLDVPPHRISIAPRKQN